MARSPLENVVAHWHKLIENFQTSSKDYYDALEDALERRKIPDLKTSRVDISESGMFGAKREYLRLSRERLMFDICGAPFGTGFFFSWWQSRKRPSWVLFHLLLVAFIVVALIVLVTRFFPLSMGPWELAVTVPAAFFLALWLIMLASRLGWHGPEDAVLAVPLLDLVYERLFAPPTYYKMDTMLMFQSAVHSAVLEVIDGLTTQKGIRALSEDERKPILRELLRG